jgi:hypothetical protein
MSPAHIKLSNLINAFPVYTSFIKTATIPEKDVEKVPVFC